MSLKRYLSFLVLLVIFLLETIFPHFKGRKKRVPHGAYNICLSLLNSLLYVFLFSVVTLNVMQWSLDRHIGLIHHFFFLGQDMANFQVQKKHTDFTVWFTNIKGKEMAKSSRDAFNTV